MNLFKRKVPEGVPKRIIFESLLDLGIGVLLGISLANIFDIGLVTMIQELGGLPALGAFIAVLGRIYGKNKSKGVTE